jgi:uncharacterized DUF497 family protein
MEFEWDKEKANENFRKHGVNFEEVELAFEDEYGIEGFDEFNSDEEIRYRLIALSPVRLLFVSYTIRDEEIIRIISARKATSIEEKFYNDARR